jgi:hypothetical protein
MFDGYIDLGKQLSMLQTLLGESLNKVGACCVYLQLLATQIKINITITQ